MPREIRHGASLPQAREPPALEVRENLTVTLSAFNGFLVLVAAREPASSWRLLHGGAASLSRSVPGAYLAFIKRVTRQAILVSQLLSGTNTYGCCA